MLTWRQSTQHGKERLIVRASSNRPWIMQTSQDRRSYGQGEDWPEISVIHVWLQMYLHLLVQWQYLVVNLFIEAIQLWSQCWEEFQAIGELFSPEWRVLQSISKNGHSRRQDVSPDLQADFGRYPSIARVGSHDGLAMRPRLRMNNYKLKPIWVRIVRSNHTTRAYAQKSVTLFLALIGLLKSALFLLDKQ